MTEIEKHIKEIIEEVTNSKYIGKLKVIEEPINDSTLWMLLLYLDLEITPMILAYEGTENDFIEFITKELKLRKLHTVKFWKAIQESHRNEFIECDGS